ncbi:integral membrane protein GPR180 isoform X2 [Phycodurus eques]|uniref:integral membrane protein GPR180 isoform X2 n=1 Tax=Phycodurus eques TaxID=693459 RepID=UPI002ACD3A70|nr:integral membrane protein GPR180 isoform X2 [Phycodurus eques]
MKFTHFVEVCGKTVSGLFKTEVARQHKGQFITKFMYQGEEGLLVCQLDNPSLAAEKESRLLLYPNADEDWENLGCSERLTRAQFTVSLSQEEHNQTIPQRSSPTVWHALYADRYTCQEAAVIPSHGELRFTVLLLNADSAGNPLEHFSAEEAGLHTFYFLLLLAYFVASCIYIKPLYQALRKGGPMHTVLKVLTTSLALQGCSALCNYIHMARYSRDGVGIPPMGSLAAFWAAAAQVSTLYTLLSLCASWSLSRGRKPQSRPLQWEQSPASTAVAVCGVVLQGALLLWEQYSASEGQHRSYRSLAGILLIALRVTLALLLASVLYQIISTERSTLKRDFYLCFAKVICSGTQLAAAPASPHNCVLSTGMLAVVPLPSFPRPHVRHLQRAPEGEGGHHWCDSVSVHLRGDPLPAVSVAFPLLGSLRALLGVAAAHHVQEQPEGALLSTCSGSMCSSFAALRSPSRRREDGRRRAAGNARILPFSGEARTQRAEARLPQSRK